MTICSRDPKRWSMCLVKYRTPCLPGEPTQEEFCFKDVEVVDEVITGKVFNRADEEVADLSGTCIPSGDRSNVSRMTFFFTAINNDRKLVEILLTGWGFQPASANPLFFGGFVVLEPLSRAPAALPRAPVNFDEGDTGTGTGMQADCFFPTPN